MWHNAQHIGDLLVRQAFEHRESEHLTVAFWQTVNELHHILQRNTSHFALNFRRLQMLCILQLHKGHLCQMVFIFRRDISRYRHHPCLCFPVITQFIKGGEDDHEGVMQHIADGLFVTDIPTAYAPHPLGVCLVQFSEGIRIPLSAPFYQPRNFHRKHDVSIYYVR